MSHVRSLLKPTVSIPLASTVELENTTKCNELFANKLHPLNDTTFRIKNCQSLKNLQSQLNKSETHQKKIERKIEQIDKQIADLTPKGFFKIFHSIFRKIFKNNQEQILLERKNDLQNNKLAIGKRIENKNIEIHRILDTLESHLKIDLAQPLTKATQNLVNQLFNQMPGDTRYHAESLEEGKETSIDQNADGTFMVRLKVKHSVRDRLDELFKYDSTCELHLDKNGNIQTAVIKNTVDKYNGLNPSTPALKLTDGNYPQPATNDSEHYKRVSVAFHGIELPLTVSKDFTMACDRQIDQLAITGIGTLAARHAKLKTEKMQLIEKYEEAVQRKDPIAEQYLERQNEVSATYEKEVLDDFLTTIYKKLGLERRHLFAQTTYFFDPALVGPLAELVAYKYMQFPEQHGNIKYAFTLDIPKDETLPIKITAKGQGKIDQYDVSATGTFTIHLDGHVEFEGLVS